MATHRAAISVTVGAGGWGSADASLKLPSSLARHAQLLAVAVNSDSAVAGSPHITLTELDVDSDGAATEGQILYYTEAPRDVPVTVVSQERVVDQDDVVLSSSLTAGGLQFIRTKSIRCDIDNAVSGDVFVVSVYYETAGDYRF